MVPAQLVCQIAVQIIMVARARNPSLEGKKRPWFPRSAWEPSPDALRRAPGARLSRPISRRDAVRRSGVPTRSVRNEGYRMLKKETIMTQPEKGTAFRALHHREHAFIIPNPWDTGTARLLAHLDFEALGTTRMALAFSA